MPLFLSTVVFGITMKDAGSPSFPHPMLNFGRRKYSKTSGEMSRSDRNSNGSVGESWLYGHPEQDRAISLREAAKLQSFEDNYVFFADSLAKTAKQIGNAVPVRFAEAIGIHIRRLVGELDA